MIRLAKGVEAMKNIKPLEWIWEPLIPRSSVSILASRGGVGKSGFALWLADKLAGKGKNILYIDAERCGYHIKQRSEDWALKHLDKIMFTISDLADGSSQTAAPNTLIELYNIIKECDPSPDLVILDSLTIFARGLDTNRRDIMATYFEEMTKIAVECDTGILMLAHTKKRQSPDDALNLDSVAGSGAITDLVRSVMIMDFDAGENGRIITQQKLNLTAKAKPLTFKITATGIIDVSFMENLSRSTGTKADNFRTIAITLLKDGYSKKEVRSSLKLEGATPVEYGRAIDWASEKLKIKWDNDIRQDS